MFQYLLSLIFVSTLLVLGEAKLLRFKLSAVNLPSSDYGGFDDPYVLAYAKDKNEPYSRFGETSIYYATRNPVWDEVLEFQHIKGMNQKWKFLVKDWDLGWNEDDALGRVEVKVDDMAKAIKLRRPIKLYLSGPRGGVLYFIPVV